MPLTPKVVGIGHITCDIICPITGWPEPDTKTFVSGITLAGGGPSANAIAALAKLNISCAFVGKLGTDLLGAYTLAAHHDAGIDMSHTIVSETAVSPVSIILTDLTASTRTILLTKGAETTLSVADLDWEWLKQASIIHLDGHQMPVSLAVAKRAQSWPGCRVVVDAGSMREGMLTLCGMSDVVIASQRFAREFHPTGSPAEWLSALHELGAQQVGVTLGSDGSVMLAEGKFFQQPAFAVPVQDTTGAGDSFHGGFIFGMLMGYQPQECLRFASAVAAIKCRGIGARESLPELKEVSRFLESH